jgi:ABC-2 type transport system permease protein
VNGSVPLVARREIVQRLRGKAWYVSTAVAVIAVLAIGIVARFVTLDQTRHADVAVTAEAPASLSVALVQIGAAADVEVDVLRVGDDEATRAVVAAGDADAAITGTADDPTALFADEVDGTLQSVLQQAWTVSTIESALQDAGVPGERIGELVAAGALEVTTIGGDDDDQEELSTLVGMFSSIALFIAVQIYGSYILIGVVEEKSTAVVEVLLARIRAWELLIG